MAASMSLIIVTYNRREELRKSLLLLRQQRGAFELIVVDNASHDGSADVVRELWPSAVLMEMQENVGAPSGRNRGMEVAQGELLVFLDDDASFADPETLERVRHRFEANPRLGILACDSRLASTGQPERAAIPRRDKQVLSEDYETSYFCAVGFAMRREVFERIGGFYEGFLIYGEELDLAWRTLEAGYDIIRAADFVVLHRLTPLARPRGRWMYSNARNRVWLALLYLPWRYVVSHAAIWWSYLFFLSLRYGLVTAYFRGVFSFLRHFPQILSQRRVLSKATVRRIAELNGRLRY